MLPRSLLASLRTIRFIVRKEVLQVLRDRIMLVQIFVPPLLQLLVVAQAMTFEVKQTDLVVVDLDRRPASERLVEALVASGRFTVERATASGEVADRALLTREANAILRIPSGFDADLAGGRPVTVQLVLNAEDGASAGVIQSYAARIIGSFSEQEGRRAGTVLTQGARSPGARSPGVAVQTRTLYNPQGEYLAYMAIGLLASLITIVGVLLTSQNIAREREIGTLEQLNVTPITHGQFIAGKLLPFWGLGLLELTLGLGIIRFAFGISFEGSLLVVYAGAAMYLLAALGLGLLISTAVETQQQAQFITFFALVALLFLGGIFTPVQSMPGWAQTLAEANPIMHFVDLLRTVLMQGGGWSDVAPRFVKMAVFAASALGLAIVRYRKTSS